MSMEQLEIMLPHELAEVLRAKVASGEYESESAVIQDRLLDFASSQATDPELEYWLQTEVARRSSEADEHPGLLLSVEEMRRAVAEAVQQA